LSHAGRTEQCVTAPDAVDLEMREYSVDRMRGCVDERPRSAALAFVVVHIPRATAVAVGERTRVVRVVQRNATLERRRKDERFEGRTGLAAAAPAEGTEGQ